MTITKRLEGRRNVSGAEVEARVIGDVSAEGCKECPHYQRGRCGAADRPLDAEWVEWCPFAVSAPDVTAAVAEASACSSEAEAAIVVTALLLGVPVEEVRAALAGGERE